MSEERKTPSKKHPLEETGEPEGVPKRPREESTRPASEIAELPVATQECISVPFVSPTKQRIPKPVETNNQCKIEVWTAEDGAMDSPQLHECVYEATGLCMDACKLVGAYVGRCFDAQPGAGETFRAFADNETFYPRGVLRIDWQHDMKECWLAGYRYAARQPVFRVPVDADLDPESADPVLYTDSGVAVFEARTKAAGSRVYLRRDAKGLCQRLHTTGAVVRAVSDRYLYIAAGPYAQNAKLFDCDTPQASFECKLPAPYAFDSGHIVCVCDKVISRDNGGHYFYVNRSAPNIPVPCDTWPCHRNADLVAVQPDVLVLNTPLEFVVIAARSMEPRVRVQKPVDMLGDSHVEPDAMWPVQGVSAFLVFRPGTREDGDHEHYYAIDTATGAVLARLRVKTSTTVTGCCIRGPFVILSENVNAESGQYQPGGFSINEYATWYTPHAVWKSY